MNELEIYLASGFAMTDDEDEPDGGNNGDSDDGPGAPQGRSNSLVLRDYSCFKLELFLPKSKGYYFQQVKRGDSQ